MFVCCFGFLFVFNMLQCIFVCIFFVYLTFEVEEVNNFISVEIGKQSEISF